MLMTLVFPDPPLTGVAASVPEPRSITKIANTSVDLLPSSKNFLSPITSETTMAFAVPFSGTADFIRSVKELPAPKLEGKYRKLEDGPLGEEKRWIMSAVKGEVVSAQRSFKRRFADAWVAFVDLLKNAEELDIVIMVLGYLSMHLTFVSLFMSLRRLGSKFWLGTTVLFSSVFAFLFGLIVTIKMGVPINMVLLSEGLPFLVVTIGFEKPIVLTKAVLSASLALKKENRSGSPLDRNGNGGTSSIQSAVQAAVRDSGYGIVRDYAIEILILVAGAASGVQGGLCQFCFLAAWILFFDCLLLFTFYTAILTVKLEVNRIKRHVALRRALEDDGVSRRVAEEVASSDEWPKLALTSPENVKSDVRLFGMQIRDNSVSKFKALMVAGFIAINVLNFCTIPFRSGAKSTGSTLSSPVTQPPMDPFKVASNALDTIAASAKKSLSATTVTILTPIKYELQYPSLHYAIPDDSNASIFDMDFADQFLSGAGGRVVESILKSFEDPVLSKWIIIALALSLILNGYLFNAARWSIKESGSILEEPVVAAPTLKDPAAVPRAPDLPPKTNSSDSDADEGLTLKSARAPAAGKRTLADCEILLKEKKAPQLDDEELIALSLRGKIPGYSLEKTLEDKVRAVKIRRAIIARTPATSDLTGSLEKSLLPYEHYDYDRVYGACCENVVGYLPLPLGVAGPINIDGKAYFLPMATTEGVLVASTSRGCKAINAGGGATTVLTGDGMTRGPCVGFDTLARAGEAKLWLDSEAGRKVVTDAFNSTSRFARLQSLKTALAGTYLYVRFKTTTGDAMGMNMISKGVEKALDVMRDSGFEDMAIISVSGNFCTDKKAAAINWIDGRGKSVVAEAIIPGDVVRSVLKSDVDALVELNTAKNLIGSAMAGSIGGFNAHASNIVTAIFLATGQDPAQNVESSNCITVMRNNGGNLQISVSMPCIEVGTIGGGTFLPPQAAMLDILGVRGAHPTSPGSNARQLARIVAAGVLAGELSLCSALAAGHLGMLFSF